MLTPLQNTSTYLDNYLLLFCYFVINCTSKVVIHYLMYFFSSCSSPPFLLCFTGAKMPWQEEPLTKHWRPGQNHLTAMKLQTLKRLHEENSLKNERRVNRKTSSASSESEEEECRTRLKVEEEERKEALQARLGLLGDDRKDTIQCRRGLLSSPRKCFWLKLAIVLGRFSLNLPN